MSDYNKSPSEMKCQICDFPSIELTSIGGKLLCRNCVNLNYFLCNHCGKYKSIKNKYAVRNDGGSRRIVCTSCFENYYVKCSHCGFGCGKSHIRIYNENKICRWCYDTMFLCVGCNKRLFANQYYDGGLCHNCYQEEKRLIPPHDTKAPTNFIGKGPHYFGIELEVETDEAVDRKTNFARKVLQIFGGFAITKRDGSIKNGFEITTVPASRETHMEKWNIFFDNLPKGMKSYDTVTCGLHIHCSRKPLSLLTIAKMLLFVNSADNAKFITTISGRSANTYCKILKKTFRDVTRPYDRYEALNLINSDTVEFRIFRGTLKRESLFKSLEFCDALIHFCKECFCSISESKKVDKFIEYVKLHKKEYIHLWAFIQARWLRIENDLTKKMGFPLPDKPAESETYNHEPNPELRQNEDNGPVIFEDTWDDYDGYDTTTI